MQLKPSIQKHLDNAIVILKQRDEMTLFNKKIHKQFLIFFKSAKRVDEF